jgi:phosphoglycerate dehydrogenase-like enzyme
LRKILVAAPFSREDLAGLTGLAEVFWLRELNEMKLDELLPSVDCLFVHFWPKELSGERLERMRNLSFVQSALAGVNHIPFSELSPRVTVSSNAGGYSDEVGEFAWALLLAGAKRIVKWSLSPEYGASKSPLDLGREVLVLRNRFLGILGYGGIGSVVARIGRAFGMKVTVLSRKEVSEDGVEWLHGEVGVESLLRSCDAVVIALPLTRSTRNMIRKDRLDLMKKDAVLVNVARAEIVDQQAVYQHLLQNKDFVYATDVWWTKDGKEKYPPELPFLGLENFIGSPHVSGPSAVAGGGPARNSIENLVRYAKGEPVRNAVDPADYS